MRKTVFDDISKYSHFLAVQAGRQEKLEFPIVIIKEEHHISKSHR